MLSSLILCTIFNRIVTCDGKWILYDPILFLWSYHLCFLLQIISGFLTVYATAKSLQSCPTLCNPIDSSPPGSPVPGILQARTLEWGAISFSNAWKGKVKVKSLSRVQLLATPWTAAYQAPPSMGFSRQDYWSGLPLPSLEEISGLSHSIVFLCFFVLITEEVFLISPCYSLELCIFFFFPPLPFTSLLFSAICEASSDNHFAFLHFFSLGMILIPASCTMSGPSLSRCDLFFNVKHMEM